MTGRGKIEVLAPAGGPEALKAAVFCGADAVYLGGPAFGARASAKNFTREELKQAVAFCHARGVRVHVTVNTLYRDEELPQVLEFVSYLCSLPVDAVLVQDMGLFSLLRRQAPGLPLHASTQMSLHTPAGVRLLYELGASRAVLSRELSLREIQEIRASCPIELEAFVHGALCMSVSGQCYLSAALGGRSGNRGMCAQPCRLPFAALGGTGHDLSLKDLSFIAQAGRLWDAGICSAKIEGRMKRPEYVAAAVSACRKAADGEKIPPELLQNLEAVFSRSGFTDGYLTQRRGASMFGVRTREDVAGATGQVFSSLRGLYRGEMQRVPINMELSQEGERLRLSVRDQDGRQAVSTACPEKGKPPLSRERCVSQLSKTGGTPFLAREVLAPQEGARAGVSDLNGLRREALEALMDLRAEKEPIPFEETPFKPLPRVGKPRTGRLPIRACFRKMEQVCREARRCQNLTLPLGTDWEELKKLEQQGFPPVFLELPRAMFGREDQVRGLMEKALKAGYRDFVCGNLGHLALCRELGARGHGSFSLNIFNTASLAFFRKLGLVTAEVSFELSGREAAALGGNLPRGVMLYGRQPLMLTRNCPLANSPKGCLHCRRPGFLTDRKGKKFPVLCGWETGLRSVEVLNSVPLWLGDKEAALGDIEFGIFRFTVENPVECEDRLRRFFQRETPDFDYTRGLFQHGVE